MPKIRENLYVCIFNSRCTFLLSLHVCNFMSFFQQVYLYGNHLSELSIDLMPWSKLKILGMTMNYWLCNCDLANIVTTQGAGEKFKPHEIPV